MNCFIFIYEHLKTKGYKIPDTFENLEYKKDYKILINNNKQHLENNLHFRYFESFTREVKKAIENDIILHKRGIGIALDNKRFMTLNHLKRVIIRPIKDIHTIRRITNG